ncbi:MAG: hypothetical protein DRP71_16460 [Verrucomicrobia bacterium]|nr:MAG: hypothetical protein DRP71_16460 [Verrucomicrobiota bacterium]
MSEESASGGRLWIRNRFVHFVWLLFLIPGAQGLCSEPAPDILIADFEGDSFGDWEVEGEAFRSGPARLGEPGVESLPGVEGEGFAISHPEGYFLEGTLTSPPFTIERSYINFLIGGGEAGPLFLELLVGDNPVRTAVPTDRDRLVWNTWDVSALIGQTVRVRIVDDKRGHPEGYLFVDGLHQSADPRAASLATRTLNQEILTAFPFNPDPRRIPTLGVWQHAEQLYVSALFPELPGFVCDSWCYEIPGIEFIGAGAREGGVIELEHRVTRGPDVFRIRTEVIPSPGSIEFVVCAVADIERGEHLPEALPSVNLCFQLKRAQTFKSDRSSPGVRPYPEFVKRCFIFTDKGRTFLNDTERRKIPARPATDPENNPPWVQSYVGVWENPPEPESASWADTSSDRYVVPIIGVVSTDGKHLVALVDDSADSMSQAWHDCLHTNAKWQPVDTAPADQTWRMKVYLMDNDPDALLERARQDFPDIDKLAKDRVPLKERADGEVHQ